MHTRDKKILSDLAEFRVLSRDDIIDLHFTHVRYKILSCNQVLKRLRHSGYIEVNTKTKPYLYFSSPSPIKKDSQKIRHFRAIVDFYKQICKAEEPLYIKVEPKYGSTYMEPDVFMIWKDSPYFVEVQRSLYSTNMMKAKLERYQNYLNSEEWKKEWWQNEPNPLFPTVWIISEKPYSIDPQPFRIIQSSPVDLEPTPL